MPSLVQGYNYDIFISYRQKDNKRDGWVTEFVGNLKGELESTFKEEISVYFDINPHDGLLETHDVNASLKEKLKCLVFIPIISQTYCDSKSFAWQHEFIAFNKMTKEDQFGRGIHLASGNVASRILPIKIHDLDPEDKDILENELGGFIRGIEFIYKEPGVNRPLKPEDSEKKNLNNTIYRNQINKVANAVKEIIGAIKNPFQHYGSVKEEGIHLKPETQLNEKSIAVLPFLNYSTEPDQEAMSEGLTDEVINHLFKIKSLDKVVSLRNVLTYKGTHKNILQIANELEVNYILDGTYKKIGDSVKIRATLMDPKSDKRLWQDEYDRPYNDLIAIQADISLQIANKLNAFLTKSELKNIQKIPTTNQEAYELMQKVIFGMRTAGNVDLDQFLELLLKAIKLDPFYADAYAQAGIMTLFKGVWFGSKGMTSAVLDALPFFEKALELDQNNAWAHFGMGNINDWSRWDYVRAEKEYFKAYEVDPNKVESFWNYYVLGEFFLKMNRIEDALTYLEKITDLLVVRPSDLIIKIKALSGNKNEAIDLIIKSYSESDKGYLGKWIGEDYIWLQEYDSAKKYLESGIEFKDPVMQAPRFQTCLALAYYYTNNHKQAETIIRQLKDKNNETIAGSPEYFIGWYYSGIGENDSAFEWLEKAYQNRSPELPWLKVNPIFNNLKKDSRYWDLYERTGHKAYDDYIAGMKK